MPPPGTAGKRRGFEGVCFTKSREKALPGYANFHLLCMLRTGIDDGWLMLLSLWLFGEHIIEPYDVHLLLYRTRVTRGELILK